MEDQLDKWHARLNQEAIVPGRWYRRNHVEYPLVCYVNILVGLYLSQRFDAIPVFLDRACRHMEQRTERPENQAYYRAAREYLEAMAQFLCSLADLDESVRRLIPPELLSNPARE